MQINYKVLHGSQVRLEPLNQSHIEGLFKAGSDHDDWRYLPIAGFAVLEDAHAWYQQAMGMLKDSLHYPYVLVSPENNEVMGSSRYMNVQAKDYVLEIGYTWLARKFQRSAVNTQAKLLLLDNAFENMGANRVEIKTDARNLKSQRAIERIGAKKEGVLRKHKIAQGGFVRDTVMYSIINAEWPTVKANLIQLLRGE